MGAAAWLQAFLNKRRLDKPDGRPLYSYQASTLEYQELKGLATETIRTSYRGGAYLANCACFVLFFSEWYRRDYHKHFGWSWEPVWQELGSSIEPLHLREVVPHGLETFWQRPVRFFSGGHRSFLGSVFSEGGLPFQVLKESDSKFQSMFARILRRYEHARLLGRPVTSLVSDVVSQSHLPQVFSDETSVDLIANMAKELVSLVQFFELENLEDPAGKLDSVKPDWRETFPLPLDDETGSQLLNGLLSTASKEALSGNKPQYWGCKHFLSISNREVIKAEVSFPTEVIFDLATTPASPRFELSLFEGDKTLKVLRPGYAVIEGLQAKVRVLKSLEQIDRPYPDKPLVLVASVGGAELARLPIPGSELQVGDVPLGFIKEEDGRWMLQAQGSFDVVEKDLVLMLPKESSLEYQGGEVKILDPVLGNEMQHITGESSITVSGEELFVINTGAALASRLSISLRGKRLEWPCMPAMSFYGLPLLDNDADSLGALGMHFSGRSAANCQANEMLGSQTLSVRSPEGKSFLRRKVGILPEDFSLEMKSNGTAGEGSLVFSTSTRCVFECLSDRVRSHSSRDGTLVELQLKAIDLPPSTVDIAVIPNLASDPVILTLPFPGSGCIAFDADGGKLGRHLNVDDLLGARAYLYPKHGRSLKYKLLMYLLGGRASHASYLWNYHVQDKPVEVSLYGFKEQVENLLSLDNSIDQQVELQITSGADETTFRIQRFTTEYRLDPIQREICQEGNDIEDNQLVLMYMAEPERKPLPLEMITSEGVFTGRYRLPDAQEKSGPALIVSLDGQNSGFRPIYLADPSPSFETGDIGNLQAAVKAFNPEVGYGVFISVFDEMGINPSHGSWVYLRALFDNYKYLPLPTFAVWKALIHHSEALALSLFKFEMNADYLSRLETEFPFFWEFLPVPSIRNAAHLTMENLIENSIPADQSQAITHSLLGKLGNVVPSYREGLEKWLCTDDVDPAVHIPETFLPQITGGWYQDLLRFRADDTWPDFGGEKLRQWYKSQQTCPISIEPNSTHHCAVLYLPIFAAAVASGRAQVNEVFGDSAEAVFFLRQVRGFSLNEWFVPVFQLCVQCYSLEPKD